MMLLATPSVGYRGPYRLRFRSYLTLTGQFGPLVTHFATLQPVMPRTDMVPADLTLDSAPYGEQDVSSTEAVIDSTLRFTLISNIALAFARCLPWCDSWRRSLLSSARRVLGRPHPDHEGNSAIRAKLHRLGSDHECRHAACPFSNMANVSPEYSGLRECERSFLTSRHAALLGRSAPQD